MTEIKTFNLRSLFKVGFAFYLVVMLLVGVVGLMFLLFNLVTNFSTTNLTASLGAVVVYLLLALVYGLIAAVILSLSGLVYNKIAKKWGGVRMEVEG